MDTEVRKLPKKTVIYMIILGVLGIVWFFLVSYGQSSKVIKILNSLGYKNISNVKVYANHEFVREDTNIKGYKYTISFINQHTSEECKGFVVKDLKRNVEKDLICKKIILEIR
jgi:hypothetical protein